MRERYAFNVRFHEVVALSDALSRLGEKQGKEGWHTTNIKELFGRTRIGEVSVRATELFELGEKVEMLAFDVKAKALELRITIELAEEATMLWNQVDELRESVD